MQLATFLFHSAQVGIPSRLYPNNLTFSHCLPWKNMVGTHLPRPWGIWRQLIGLWLLEAFGDWRYLRDQPHQTYFRFHGARRWRGWLSGVLEPPLERFGHDLRERSFKAAVLALPRSYIFSFIYLSFIIHLSFMFLYPRGHGDNWSQPLQGPSLPKDALFMGWKTSHSQSKLFLVWSLKCPK